MNNFIQVDFIAIPHEQQELLIAHLAEAGYEGFEESDTALKAFVAETNFDRTVLNDLSFKYKVGFTEQFIPAQNWNALWESNFDPVRIGNFVGIRAAFHPLFQGVEHEIVITPKMSFGTGHHATTAMMIAQMEQFHMQGKTVFDFGTGTGVLAILAERCGAEKITAIDNDDWSIENAAENITMNGCKRIQLRKAASPDANERYDVIIANINKNVILANLDTLVESLTRNGTILLSGLLSADEPELLEHVKKYPLRMIDKSTVGQWICLKFSH